MSDVQPICVAVKESYHGRNTLPRQHAVCVTVRHAVCVAVLHADRARAQLFCTVPPDMARIEHKDQCHADRLYRPDTYKQHTAYNQHTVDTYFVRVVRDHAVMDKH